MCLLGSSLRSPQRSVSPKKWIQTEIGSLLFFSAVQIFWEWGDWVSLLSFFFFLLSLFFFFNRPSLQIVVLEKILHVQSEPGKFSPSCGPVCFYGALRG